MITKIKILLCLILVNCGYYYAQGCSDAGFCTLEHLKPDSQNESGLNNFLRLGASFGKADNEISTIGNYIEYSRQISSELSFQAKLTSLYQTGNDISKFGLSDIFLTSNFRTSEKTSLVLGIKIPLSKSDVKENGIPLPMDYQSSLGTFDLIAGYSFFINKFQISTAVQFPLTQNDNMFIQQVSSEMNKFVSTNEFERKGDLLLRISYPLYDSPAYDFTCSLLPIYHLGNDEFTISKGQKIEIDGSSGLTLNFNAFFNYYLSNTSSIQINLGMPFIVRDIRPDGLTRSFIATLEYKISF